MVAPTPARVACFKSFCAESSPTTAPMNGPKIMPGKPRKMPIHQADERADNGSLGSAEFLCAENGRPKIDA